MNGARSVKCSKEMSGYRMMIPMKGVMRNAFKAQKHLQERQQSKEPLNLPNFQNNMQIKETMQSHILNSNFLESKL